MTSCFGVGPPSACRLFDLAPPSRVQSAGCSDEKSSNSRRCTFRRAPVHSGRRSVGIYINALLWRGLGRFLVALSLGIRHSPSRFSIVATLFVLLSRALYLIFRSPPHCLDQRQHNQHPTMPFNRPEPPPAWDDKYLNQQVSSLSRPMDLFPVNKGPGADPLAGDWSYDSAVDLFSLNPADMDQNSFDFADGLANTDSKGLFMDSFSSSTAINGFTMPTAEDTVSLSSVRTPIAVIRAELTSPRTWTATTSHGQTPSLNHTTSKPNKHQTTTPQLPSPLHQRAPPFQQDGPPAPRSNPRNTSRRDYPPPPSIPQHQSSQAPEHQE